MNCRWNPKTKRSSQLALLIVGVVCSGFAYAAPKQEKKPEIKQGQQKPLSVFMRKKLSASSMILEGLAVEDFSLVSEGARKLREMSQTEKWRVLNDPMYRQFSEEFLRITNKLTEAAKDEKLDTAALRWVDATMSCIECHQYVRKILITKK